MRSVTWCKKICSAIVLVISLCTFTGCTQGDNSVVRENREETICEIDSDVKAYLKTLNVTKSTLVKYPKYENIKKECFILVDDLKVSVSEEEIEQFVKEMLESQSELVKIKGRKTVRKGDFARVNYRTYYKGKLRSEREGEIIKVGSGNYDKAFEEILTGLAVGKTYKRKMKVPDDSIYKEMAGKTVTVSFTIESINNYVIPELNDEFVQRELDCNSVEEFYKKQRKRAEKEKKQIVYKDKTDALFDKITSQCEFEMDKEEIADYAVHFVYDYEQLAYVQDISLEQYAKKNGMTLDELYQNCYEMSEKYIKRVLFVGHYVNELQISLSSDETEEKSVEEKYSVLESDVADKFIR